MLESPQPWPTMLGHLPEDLPDLQKAICYRSMQDLFVCENPVSSNRGGRIDTYNTRAGSPLGSYWCGSVATAWWIDAGADAPPHDRASCDVIVDWLMDEGLWVPKGRQEPEEGWLVLYTNHKPSPLNIPGRLDAVHVELLIRRAPYLLTVGGNKAWSGFSTNGEAVTGGRVDMERVYGYGKPRRRAA